MRLSVWYTVFVFIVGLTIPASAALDYETYTSDDGVTVLLISGEFDADDPVGRLVSVIVEKNPTLISFNSSGGNISAAINVGRVIRRFQISTIQLRATECASACALAFFGGVQRFADPGSIGVHKAFFDSENEMDRDEAVSAVQSLTAELIAYLVEMGISPELLQLALNYESTDIRYLSKSEMDRYNVTTNPLAEAQANDQPDNRLGTFTQAEPTAQKPLRDPLEIPVARSGIIRHYRGYVDVRSQPSEKASVARRLLNRTRVDILGSEDRWYRIRSAQGTGFAHHSWVKVDQFAPTGFEQKFVQIKSFATFNEAASFVRRSALPTRAYLASNGWFAIVLDGLHSDSQALELLTTLKQAGTIPEDSFKTYGNTYVRSVCCD